MENKERRYKPLTADERAHQLGVVALQLQEHPKEPVKPEQYEEIMYQTATEWEVHTRRLAGRSVVVAERKLPIALEINDTVVEGQSKPPERYFKKQGHRVIMMAKVPFTNEDAASILLTELDLLSKVKPRAHETPKLNPELVVKPSNENVIKNILLSKESIAARLGIPVSTVRSRIRSFREDNRMSQQSMIEQGIAQGRIDLSVLPADKIDDKLTARQYELIINHSFRSATKAAALLGLSQSTLQDDWKQIHNILGTETEYAAYAMALRDGLIPPSS